MAYQLVTLSSLSGRNTDYTVVGTDLLYTTLGTSTGSLSSIKLTVDELATYLESNHLWLSGGDTDKLYPKSLTSNLGVGTNSPEERVHVSGNTKITGSLSAQGGTTNYFANSVGIGTNSPDTILNIEAASTPTVKITDTTNSVSLELYSQDDIACVGTSSDHSLFLKTNQTTRVQLSGVGVGICGVNGYINFNSGAALDGSDGYGIRDNSGRMEVKHSSGTWTEFPLVLDTDYKQLFYYDASGYSTGGWSPPGGAITAAQAALGDIPVGSFVFIRYYHVHGVGTGNGGATIVSYPLAVMEVLGTNNWVFRT
jgi:hypothetical protein